MGFASDDPRMRQTSVRTIAERYRKAGQFATRYWTPELHVGAFALPRFIAAVKRLITIAARRSLIAHRLN